MMEVVDVSVETIEGDHYQFVSVPETVVRAAVALAEADGGPLSMVNLDSAAIVIPWKSVRRVFYASVLADEADPDAWRILWERELMEARAVG